MAGFDPDAHLAKLREQQAPKPEAGGFDPDAHLAKLREQQLGPSVLQETHPEVTWGQRLAIKNLGTSQEQSMQYLRDKHPDMDVTQIGKQIAVKKKNEKDWRVLDPEGFDPADITDVLYDIPAGVVQGGLTAAAGLTTGGLGAVPMGAASGAGLEAFRQYLGHEAGVNQKFGAGEMTDIAVAGALGGLVPAALGSGASKAAQEAYLASKGGFGEALKAVAPKWVGSKFPALAVTEGDGAAKNILTSAGELSSSDVAGGLSKAATQTAGDLLGTAQESPIKRGMVGIFDKFRDTTAAERKALVKKYDVIEELGRTGLDDYYFDKGTEFVAAVGKKHQDVSRELGEGLSKIEGSKLNSDKLFDPLWEREDDLYKIAESLKTEGSDEAYQSAKAVIDKYLVRQVPVTDEAGQTFMTYRPLGEITPAEALNIKAQISDLLAYAKQGGYKNLEGKSPIDTQTINALRRSAENITREIDAMVTAKGGKYAALWKEQKDLERLVLPKLQRESGMAKTMEEYLRKVNKGQGQDLEKAAEKVGFNLKDFAENINLYRKFNEPSWTPVSGAGTSTSKTIPLHGFGQSVGQLITRAMGIGDSGAFVGGAIGGAAANAAASRGATKAVTAAQRSMQRSAPGLAKGVEKAKTAAPWVAYPWVNMKRNGGE